GYEAVNLGEKDLALGLPLLHALQGRFHGAFLAAGLRDETGMPLGKEYTIVMRKIGDRDLRVGVVGMVSRAILAGSSGSAVKAEAAESVLARLQAVLRRNADVLVLLYHGPRSEAEQLAKGHPEYDLVVFAHAGDHAA